MTLEGVRVPSRLLLGEEGQGFRPVMATLNAEASELLGRRARHGDRRDGEPRRRLRAQSRGIR